MTYTTHRETEGSIQTDNQVCLCAKNFCNVQEFFAICSFRSNYITDTGAY